MMQCVTMMPLLLDEEAVVLVALMGSSYEGPRWDGGTVIWMDILFRVLNTVAPFS